MIEKRKIPPRNFFYRPSTMVGDDGCWELIAPLQSLPCWIFELFANSWKWLRADSRFGEMAMKPNSMNCFASMHNAAKPRRHYKPLMPNAKS